MVEVEPSAQADPEALPTETPTDRWHEAEKLLALAAVAAAGFNHRFALSISTGLIAGILLCPLWSRHVGRFRYARVLLVLWPLAIGWGLVLAASTTDRSIDQGYATSTVALLLSGLAAVVLILWARRILAMHWVLLAFGAGGLVGAIFGGGSTWKFDLALPVTLLALGVVERPGRRVLPAAVIAAAGVYSAFNDSRSLFAFCAMAALLSLWQSRPTGAGRARPLRTGLVMAGAALVVYLVVSALLTRGYFGQELEERSTEQIEATGSLLLGGRPEWSANAELMRSRPMGYGIGVRSDWRDLMVAREGFASIRFEPGGYASHYMFNGGFALHSVIADLWVACGLAGLALGLTMTVALVAGLVRRLAARAAPTSVLFTSLLGLWYLAFGPIYSNWLDVCMAIGLVLVARDEPWPGGESARHEDTGDSAGAPAPGA